MFDLISPDKPELWPPMNKQHQRLALVSRLYIVKLDSIDCHELVFSQLWILETGWRTDSGLDREDSSSSLVQSHEVANKEDWDGDEQPNDDCYDSCPLYHCF